MWTQGAIPTAFIATHTFSVQPLPALLAQRTALTIKTLRFLRYLSLRRPILIYPSASQETSRMTKTGSHMRLDDFIARQLVVCFRSGAKPTASDEGSHAGHRSGGNGRQVL